MLIRLALIVSIAALFAAAMAGGAVAQTTPTPMVDYDLDDDGLIEVASADQWRAIHYDLNGDGTPESRSAAQFGTDTAWATAYPNPLPGAGCPARDHDDDPTTPDQASCIGYELIDDVDLTGAGITVGGSSNQGEYYTAKIVGNGFAIINNTRQSVSATRTGIVTRLSPIGVIEGIGVRNPNYHAGGISGGIVGRLEGTVIGSYVEGGRVYRSGRNGGIAGRVTTHAVNGYGLIAHSYVRGTNVGSNSIRNGGLAGQFEHQRGTTPVNRSTCLNSYFSGDVDASGARGTITGQNERGEGRFINCVGDSTTDSSDGSPTTTTGAGSGSTAATYAAMTAPTGYTGPFAAWDDYPIDGSITQLDASAPRTDVWDFGDDTTLPVLKAWGHDRSVELVRDQTGTDMVNLCTRTPAVANEIIRLLKDDTFADGVTGPVPADVMSLGTCTSSADTEDVSVDNLRDYAATTAANPLNLRPDRTDPASPKLTSLSWHDFAYLVNAPHIDLSGNALESVPPRLFQGVPLGWLDLSNNELTTLPADLFVGIANIPSTARTGNAIHLNGNRLTDTGIPGRIFDTMIHINGLDLRDNALTRVNTRWFEELEALGDKPASATAPVSYLGLGLSGNAVTEHYHANKLFTGVRNDIEAYTGATAGDDLLAAIKAVITAAAGGTAPTTLDLDSIDYYVNDGANAGYQPSGSTCPSGLTLGTLGDAYFGGTTPECYVLPHWVAPGAEGAMIAAPTDGALALEAEGLVISFRHATSASTLAYEFRYRELPSDPNSDWTQHWQSITVTAGTGPKSITVPGASIATGHQVQVRVITTAGQSEPLVLVLAPDLDALTNLEAVEETGTLVISWDSPENFLPDRYEYRTRRTGTTEWSDWMAVEHEGARGDRQSHRLTNLGSGVSLQIQLRFVIATAASPTASVSGSTRVSVPDLESITPVVREISVNAGDTVMLMVDVYNAQSKLENALAISDESPLVFRWSESGTGGGSFSEPASGRRVTYTVPSLPGRYTVLAEAQPDGICISHHGDASAITDAERAPCIATFTLNVSRAPGQIGPQDPPVNPPGAIPSSMTDSAGVAYSVFTPVDGGTFTGTDITVSAGAGAVPDRTLLGVSAAASEVPVPAPIPGASMSLAGSFYDVNAITSDGSSPLLSLTLDAPLNVCLPYPDEFRAELSNVVAVERQFNGELAILTTKVRSNAGVLTVCGAVSTLPATVGVAKLGTVPAIQPTPMPDDPLPEAGGAAPSHTLLLLALLLGALLLTWIYRMRRISNR